MFTKLLIVSALASAAFATECTRTYTVKEGDWCDTISQAHNVSTYQLSTVNADKIDDACTNLEIGLELCLGTKDQDCTITHNVVYGDTCDKIMQGAAINATMLYANNPQIDEYCSNIYIGEVLCVAGAYAAPEPVPDRQVGSPGGEPAGPPAPAPYPEAKPQTQTQTKSNDPAPTPANNTPTSANSTPTPSNNEPAATPAPENSQPAVPAPDDDDDADLPECEDPNDDGYY
ncbi:unnamed protein product [Rhizoctonia solani]|uniref:LysM domain-containing protein n=1 Tax=Rhizoctonia solani TaxID=456999 RepID=A0A8H3D4H7_9AGAM|nr:unnamed protein product [Rhizoctonia solani]